ncbi:MAG TPA: stage II sporulation protein M [Nitrosopumilaceae archaeon]|nr:stage II sporulation protein M [Nitrosopumilaceae archaeon]
MLSKKRIIIFFIFMGLFTTTFQIGSMMEPTEEEARAFLEEFEELIDDIDAFGIFSHNTLLSLPMFIPGFGIAWGFFSAWSTGFAFAALVSLTPALSEIPALALLYLSPFGIMELVAYSIATSRSYILIWMIIKKINLRTAMRGTSIEIGILVGLLLVGGILENHMIELAGESGFEFG